MKKRKFFETLKEATAYRKNNYTENEILERYINIYDLKKTYPNRKKQRFLVGTYFDWLEL